MRVTKEYFNFVKLLILLKDHGTKVLQEKMENELSKLSTTFQDLLTSDYHLFIHLFIVKKCCICASSPRRRQPVINKKQLTLLFKEDKEQSCKNPERENDQVCVCCFKANTTLNIDEMDISLLACLLINIIKLDDASRKLVERLRDERNNIVHGKSVWIETEEFEKIFQNITHMINGIAKGFDSELFQTLRNEMIELESSQQLSTEAQSEGKHSEDAQTNTDSATGGTRSQLIEEYLNSLRKEDLRALPEQLLQKLTNNLSELAPAAKDVLQKEQDGSSQFTTRLRSEIEMTILTLDQHVSPENVFHEPRQLQDSFHILYMKHVLVLHGVAGNGKTTVAYEVLNNMQDDYTPLILSSPDQLKCISPHDKVLVLLDDFLGRSSYNHEDALLWYKMFQTMYTLSQQGNSCFIFAFRENVFEDFCRDKDTFHNMLFCQEHLVHLSYTPEEKEELLKKYCDQKGVSIIFKPKDVTTSDSAKTLNTTVTPDSAKTLDMNTYKEICHTETLTGFPHSCFLFFTNDDFFELGQNYFKRPDQTLVRKIDMLRTSTDEQCQLQYAILAHMMLVDDKINLQTAVESEDFKQLASDLGLKGVTKIKLRDSVHKDNVRSLLCVERQRSVGFRHQTIREAVFISFSILCPDKMFLYCKLQLILDYFRSESYNPKKGEVNVILEDHNYAALSSRMVDEILHKHNFYQCVRLQVFEDGSFTKVFVSILLKALSNEQEPSEVVRRLLLLSSEHGNHELLSQLLDLCAVCEDEQDQDTSDNFNISMTYYREEILSIAIKKGQVKVISILVRKEKRVLYRSKCGLLPIHTAIWTGIRPVSDVLWDEYGKDTIYQSSFNDLSGRRCVHFCAMRGYIDRIREIKSHGNELVRTTDATGHSALHYAAQGGQYQTIHELVGYGLSIAEKTKDGYSVLEVLLMSLDYDERCKILPTIPEIISKAISSDNSVLWNNDYYKTLEYILGLQEADLNDLDFIIHKTHNYNIAHYACIDDAASVVSLLLDKRRDLFLKGNSTNLPMVWDIAAYLGRVPILKTLFESGLICDTDRPSLARTAKQGRRQARDILSKDRRLLLNRHEREKVWPGCCFPFVIFGQEYDFDEIEKFLR